MKPERQRAIALAKAWADELAATNASRARLAWRAMMLMLGLATLASLFTLAQAWWLGLDTREVIRNPWLPLAAGLGCALALAVLAMLARNRSVGPVTWPSAAQLAPPSTLPLVMGLLGAVVVAGTAVNGLMTIVFAAAVVVFAHILTGPGLALGLSVATITGSAIALLIWHPQASVEVGARLLLSSLGALVAMQLAARHWLALASRLTRLGDEVAGSVEAMESRLQTTQQEAEQARLVDSVTDLPNAAGLAARLGERLGERRAGQHAAGGTLAVITLTRWATSVAHLPFAEQQALTRRLVSRLRASLGADALLARTGAAEYVLWVDHPDEPVTGIDIADPVVQRLEEVLTAAVPPVTIGTLTALTVPRMGASEFPVHATDAPTLLARARAAADFATQRQVDEPCLYDRRVQAQVSRVRELVSEIGPAIRDAQLQTLFWPVWTARSGGLAMGDTAITWHHPVHGALRGGPIHAGIELLPPQGVLDVLIWHLRQADAAVQAWRREMPSARATVRLPLALLIRDQPRMGEVLNRIGRQATVPGAIVMKVDESSLTGDVFEPACEALRRLRGQGFAIALDRFGNGFSSFNQLHRIPLDMVRIDRAFTRALDEGPRALAVCETIVRVGHALGLQVWAEQVSTAAQREQLLAIGCDALQGPLFGLPVSVAAWQEMAAPAARQEMGASAAATLR